MQLVAEHGVPGRQMTPDEIRAFEPALTGKLEGGVYFPSEAHAEPLMVVQTLAEGARKLGATLLPKTELFGFETNGRKIEAVRTTRGTIRTGQVVLATGPWSAAVGRELDLRIPVLGGKGYAIVVKPFSPAPKVPLMLVEKKVAVTPRESTIRLAGTLELVDLNENITARRVDAILRGSRQFMSVPEHPEVVEIWRGLRPCTPDGVPVIGYAKAYDNVFIATGHQMLGLQSATGTGRLAADLLTGAKPAFDPQPFRATRF
jgi:D-amino-acid dehydrogenase